LKTNDPHNDALLVTFLESMLKQEPSERATVVELTEDSWLTNGNEDPVELFESINNPQDFCLE
jgi:hypothetical protein